MSRYVLIVVKEMSLSEAQAFEFRLKGVGAEYHHVGPQSWALRSEKSSQEISEELFPRNKDQDPATLRHIIVRLDAYWGYHERSLWEFLDKKDPEP